MKYSFASQSLGLQGVINARELGGYVLPDGRKIKKGKLLRGGALVSATQSDISRLRDEFKLVHIFDFRTDGEVRRAPDQEVPGADNVWLPAIDENTETLGAAALPVEAYRDIAGFVAGHSAEPLVRQVAKMMYPEMLLNEYTQLQYAAFMQITSNVREGSVFWHCSQGKDRTGLAAAFVLTALGADMDLIMEDYEISNEFYKDIVDKLIENALAKGGDQEDIAVIKTFVGVNPEYFRAALDIVEKKYGSLQNYVRNVLLISDDDCRRMQDYFLE